MHRPAHVVAERNGSARPRARRAGRPRGGAPDRAVPPDPLALCHRLLQSQVPRVVRLQGPPAVSFPVEHDGLLARRRSRRLKLADPALHARPDRGEAVVPDGVDRPDSFLQASPASKSSDHVCRGGGQAPRQGLEPAQLIQILLQLVSECRQWIAIEQRSEGACALFDFPA